MKLSYNWLSEFVKIDDIDPWDVGLQLTMSTSEIEGVEEVGSDLRNVVVGKILEVKPHPNAEHLFLTKVDVGNAVLDIISGAPNTRKDTFIPVALIGAVMPDGTKVKKAKLRGVQSFGIVCSERELGASDDHSGLWILNEEEDVGILQAGTPLNSLFPTKDYIIDIDNKSITNRPDLWGHYGFARELSAVYGRKLEPVYSQELIDEIMHAQGDEHIEVRIEDENLCPRYSAIMIGGIQVKKSSYTVRRRLYILGVRPIYNIVDITNYIMLEIGQPLHAFDASQMAKGTIIIRCAREGELVTTLDGLERRLTNDSLLITDPEKVVAVAGVMGGLNSEISDVTEKIIIEAANFNPVSIRRTAVRLGLRTEASNRFEKGIDPELTVLGIVGSVYRIKKSLPDASVLSPFVDVNLSKVKKINITLNIDWVSRMLGIPIEKKRIVDILRSLQFVIQETDKKNLVVTVPLFRATKDISIPQDLVEEVGRIYGYDNIKPELPSIDNNPPYKDDLAYFIRQMKLLLSYELSLTEVYTYSFQEDSALANFYPEGFPFLTLKNPVSTGMSKLRRSLIPGIFSLVEKNISYKDEFSIFEIGSVYVPKKSAVSKNSDSQARDSKANSLPDERQMATGLMLKKIENSPVFFNLKGKIEALFNKQGLDDTEFVPFDSASRYDKCIDLSNLGDLNVYHSGRRSLLVNDATAFGIICELNPKLVKGIGIDFNEFRVALFDIDLQLLMECVMGRLNKKKYDKLPKYPEVALALAVVVDEEISVREVRDFILSHKSRWKAASASLMDRVELFDIYRGKPLSSGKKSLAFNVYYRRKDRTLTEKEANIVHEDIAKKIRDHGWELR